MHLNFRNVGHAFYNLVDGIHSGRIPTEVGPSRNGEVLEIEEPLTITYTRPQQRVLFNSARDANPFLHVYESLYMLAGRNDVAPLAYYCSKIAQYSDDGKIFNGGYGDRWRNAGHFGLFPCENGEPGTTLRYCMNLHEPDDGSPHAMELLEPMALVRRIYDQIAILIAHLRDNPYSRRAVLSMWNVELDLLQINESKDVCCNLAVRFKIEKGNCRTCDGTGVFPILPVKEGERGAPCYKCDGKPHEQPRYLNMTVFNRSNDIILGMLGANAVHFSFLQEYMAAHLGLDVGKYNQISDDAHVYTSNWKPQEWLDAEETYDRRQDPYEQDDWKPFPLVENPRRFDEELPKFVQRHSSGYRRQMLCGDFSEPFFQHVAGPMLQAFHYYKDEPRTALKWCEGIAADDWRIAATQWIERRLAKRKARQQAEEREQYHGGQEEGVS